MTVYQLSGSICYIIVSIRGQGEQSMVEGALSHEKET